MENPYAWSTEELLSRFMNACGRAGFSGSGLVVTFTEGEDRARAHYLRGVVHACIDRVSSPFEPGVKVQPAKKMVAPSSSNDWRRTGRERMLPGTLTVKTVYYFGKNRWELTFREENDATCYKDSEYDQDGGRSWFVPLRFKAEDFTAVGQASARAS